MSIRNLFKLKPIISPKEIINDDTIEAREQVRITYYQSGYGDSTKAQGNPSTFAIGLQGLYNDFEDLCRKQLNEQRLLKQPYLEEQERQRTELKKRETALSIFEEQKKKYISHIDELKQEIIDVYHDPTRFGIDADKRPKAQFYIGLLILLPITIYLFVFYISASYSAFFKNFESDSLTAAIFDANAFSKAISDGWLEALFVVTIPFVFMGLGYLIHMFQKNKNVSSYIKLTFLFILTFLFDVILAYLIEKKIFEFEKILGEVFTPTIAIQSVNFWGIIFAGFVVYIIWGLVFDFVMKEYENVDKIKNFIKNKKEEIQNTITRKTELKSKIDQIKQEITTITGKISELQSKIDGFVFPVKEYLQYHYQYTKGWYQSINAEIHIPSKEKNELLRICDEVSKNHLKKLNLEDIDFQHLVFTKN